MTELPQPLRSRWQPLRAGLVDLFYYDAEEFRFHDGRLLLRGNNGTGKSKVLALLLPFLLDGDLSPHRVEPDADPKKRMEWNLLLGGEHPFPERLGYTWLEFGRIADDGTPVFCTVGCGLKAVAGRGIARHWFFVTDQRVGPELALVDATGTASSRERLADALGEHGTVHDRSGGYRRAVDEALFGLGEQRYGALVDLLVQLRQPQLSKRPSERALSDALTEALLPLDQAVVADVAEAFRSLEDDRAELTAMAEAHASTESFLTHYRSYARIAARRRAAGPRAAQQAYEKARAALHEAQADFSAADEAAGAAAELLRELEASEQRLDARERALTEDPDARRLHAAAEEESRAEREATRAAEDAAAAGDRVEKLAERERAAGARADAADRRVAEPRSDAVRAATRAGLEAGHRTEIDTRLDDSADHGGLRRAAGALADRQERAVAHLDGLLAGDEAARRAVVEADAAVERLAADAVDLAERRAAADDRVDIGGRQLVAEARTSLEGLRELRIGDPPAVLAALETWVPTLDGPDPIRAAYEEAGRAAASDLGRAEATLERRTADATDRRAQAAAARARLEAGDHDAPPAPHTRDPHVREGRPGAPLWQLVDFVPGLAKDDRAGVEAALEAAGVLDAWLSPDGTLRALDGDVLLQPAPPAVPGAPTLTEVLLPAVDRADPQAVAVPDAAVLAALRAIGLGDPGGGQPSSTWVDRDGRFGIGVLTGAWHKPEAAHIGRGAREMRRRARLVELAGAIEAIDAELAELGAERDGLVRRRTALTADLAGRPDDEPLRQAHAAVVALSLAATRLGEAREAADARSQAARAAADDAGTAVTSAGADLELPTDRSGVDEVGRGLTAYRLALAGLWPALSAAAEAHRTVAEAAQDRSAAEQDRAARHEWAREAWLAAESAAEAHRTLAAQVGAAVAEIERLLTEVTDALAATRRRQKATRVEHEQAVAARGRAEGRREELLTVVDSATTERARASELLQRFAATGLLAIALPRLDVPDVGMSESGGWAPDPTVRLARQIDRELDGTPTDDPSWDRAQRRVLDELKTLTDTLSAQGSTATAQLLEDGVVVEVLFRGRVTSVPELTEALARDVADRRRLLEEREREILENHLVNEVASTLQELIEEAERQVGRMNGELATRPTSTGMRLRLEWRPREDGPAGLAEARRRLLRQTSDAWSADDREAVGGFLQQRIAEVRSANETGTWLEQLTEALDYRAWHRFAILRHQNGQWRPATGPASGGERVLAASVPLFAAASAHYGSAGNPHAPRLVALDEAFAGVDDNARARYLGLLAAFDLDVVMTSEREWGCYPEVPGLAIAQLARSEGIAAVLVSHWRWDGERREPVPRPVDPLPAASVPATSASSSATDAPPGLFDGA